MKLDGFILVCREKYGVPEAWQWTTLDARNQPEDFVRVSGACPVGVWRSGPRKGRPKFGKQRDTFFVRRVEVRSAELKMKGMP